MLYFIDEDGDKFLKEEFVNDFWKFSVSNYGELKSDNIFELLQNEEEIISIMEEVNSRTKGYSPLPYYVNNVVSMCNAPGRIGGFACDYVYWLQDSRNLGSDGCELVSGLVGYIINNCWYYDFVIDGELIYVTDEMRIGSFVNRLDKWFDLKQLSPRMGEKTIKDVMGRRGK